MQAVGEELDLQKGKRRGQWEEKLGGDPGERELIFLGLIYTSSILSVYNTLRSRMRESLESELEGPESGGSLGYERRVRKNYAGIRLSLTKTLRGRRAWDLEGKSGKLRE